jgi:hypothetical protein
MKFSLPTGFLPLTPRSQSSARFFRPLTRFMPPLAAVTRSTSGFVGRKFDGETMSRI